MAGTTVASLVIPQLIGDSVRQKLGNLIKFRSIADVDSTLSGTVGMSMLVPTYNYIGTANASVAEGSVVSGDAITMSSTPVNISKAAKDILLTDESVLATNGTVVGEVEYQLAVSIANRIDTDAVNVLKDATKQSKQITITMATAQAGFAGAKTAFGEDLEGNTILFVCSTDYAKILSMPEFVAVQLGAQFMSGHVGNVLGVEIVVSDRLSAGVGVLVKTGANEEGFASPLGIAYKRDVNVETFRDMSTRSTRVGVDCHYAVYVKNKAANIGVTIA